MRTSRETVQRHSGFVPHTHERSFIAGVINSFMSTFATGDVDTRVSLFADQLRFEDPAGLRLADTSEQLRACFTAGVESGQVIRYFPERLVVAGDEAIQRARISVQVPGSRPDLLLVHLHFRLGADGRIVQLRSFFDDQCLVRSIPDPLALPPPRSIVAHLDHAYIDRAIRRYFATYASGDVETRLALFADDLVLEDPAGLVMARDKAQLQAFFADTVKRGYVLNNFLERIIVVGDEAMALSQLLLQVGDSDPVILDLIFHIAFDPTGLIWSFTTFFDLDCIRSFA